MKNLKKVLALVLAFACAFTMFAGAVVYPDVPAGSEFSEAISFLSDLGIIQGKDDGKYHAEDSITRAEACALIARMLTGDPDVSKFAGASNFTDVAKGSWKESAIGYCVVNGITVGVGNGKFEPDRAITDAEFVTMVVRAMGYETTGTTYPYGHISAAQANGLLDGVSVVPTSAALRGEDAQIMFNAMFADYARGAKMVNQTHGTTVEEYDTIAHAVWGLERAAVGTYGNNNDTDEEYMKTCQAHTWVITGRVNDKEDRVYALPIEDGTVDIYADGRKNDDNLFYTFKYEGDVDAIKGYQVELYGEGQHSKAELETIENNAGDKIKVYAFDWDIKAVKTVKGQTVTEYNPSMYDTKPANGEVELDDTTLDLDSVAANENTIRDTKSVSDKDVETALNHKDGDQYKLFDWDSDGDVDFITQSEAHYYKVDSVTSKRMIVTTLSNNKEISETWKLDGIETVDGQKVQYTAEGIEEGDIVEVTYSSAYDSGEKAAVETRTVTAVEPETAELTKVSTKGDLQLTFGDTVIDIADGDEYADLIDPENPDTYPDFKEEELGTNFALYLDRNGFIVYSKYAEEDKALYGMVLDTADGSNTIPKSLAQIDILTADDKVNTYEVEADLTVYNSDGRSDSNAYVESQNPGTHEGRHWDESLIVGNVYKFYVDENKVITKMVSMFDDEDVYTTDYEYDAEHDRLSAGATSDTSLKREASLEDAKVIFAVDPSTTLGEKAGYIKYDTTTNAHGNKGLYVDESDVRAVKFDDIPTIVRTGSTGNTKAVAMDMNANNESNGMPRVWSWQANMAQVISGLTAMSANDFTLAVAKNSNNVAQAAILGVDTLAYFSAKNVTPAIIFSAEETGGSKNKQVTVDLAIDGKFQTGLEAVAGDDANDIFGDDMNTVENKIGEGAYVEVSRNADGKITAIDFMTAGVNEYKGQFFTVNRRALNAADADELASYNQAWFADKDHLYTNDRIGDTVYNDIIKDTAFYTIDDKPVYPGAGEELDVTDRFADDLVEYNNKGEFKKTKLNEDVLSFEDAIDGSVIKDGHNKYDVYYVADIVTNADTDAVAVFAYQDPLDERDASNVATGLSLNDFKAGESTSTTVNSVAGQTTSVRLYAPYKAGDSDKLPVAGLVSKINGNTTANGPIAAVVATGATVSVEATRQVKPGTYCVDVEISTDNFATFKTETITFEVLKADGEPVVEYGKDEVTTLPKDSTVQTDFGMTEAQLAAYDVKSLSLEEMGLNVGDTVTIVQINPDVFKDNSHWASDPRIDTTTGIKTNSSVSITSSFVPSFLMKIGGTEPVIFKIYDTNGEELKMVTINP